MKYLFIILLLVSCGDPVKKVLKDPAKFEIVGQEYIRVTPLRIDTVPQYIRGRDTTIFKWFVDSVPYKVPCDSFEAKTDGGSIVQVDKKGKLTVSGHNKETFRVDTSKSNHENLSRVDALSNALQLRRDSLKNCQADLKLMKASRNNWKLSFWLLIVVAVALAALYLWLRSKTKKVR